MRTIPLFISLSVAVILQSSAETSPQTSPRPPSARPTDPWPFQSIDYTVFKTDALAEALKGRSVEAFMIDEAARKRIEIIGGYSRVPAKITFVRGDEMVYVRMNIIKSESSADLDYAVRIGKVSPLQEKGTRADPVWSMSAVGKTMLSYKLKTYFESRTGSGYTVLFRWISVPF